MIGVKVIGIRPDIREARRGLSACAEPIFRTILFDPSIRDRSAVFIIIQLSVFTVMKTVFDLLIVLNKIHLIFVFLKTICLIFRRFILFGRITIIRCLAIFRRDRALWRLALFRRDRALGHLALFRRDRALRRLALFRRDHALWRLALFRRDRALGRLALFRRDRTLWRLALFRRDRALGRLALFRRDRALRRSIERSELFMLRHIICLRNI